VPRGRELFALAARFKGRPDLNSEDFSDYSGRMQVGVEVISDGVKWRVSEIIPGEGSELDTVILDLDQWEYVSE
jgi:hypothetical protein